VTRSITSNWELWLLELLRSGRANKYLLKLSLKESKILPVPFLPNWPKSVLEVESTRNSQSTRKPFWWSSWIFENSSPLPRSTILLSKWPISMLVSTAFNKPTANSTLITPTKKPRNVQGNYKELLMIIANALKLLFVVFIKGSKF